MFAASCQIVVRGQPLPAFDLHCPLLSLPRIFGTTLANLPSEVPYLHAAAEDAAPWQQRLGDHSRSVKVGLAWAGSRVHKVLYGHHPMGTVTPQKSQPFFDEIFSHSFWRGTSRIPVL